MARRPFKRTDRLNRQVKEVLAVALSLETREDVLRQVVVTDVEVTRDLSLARVFYYLMDGAPAAEVDVALARANGFLRGRVGQQVRTRITPELRFVFDDSVERGCRVEAILAELPEVVAEPEGEAEGAAADEPAATD
jgi:ribosome-binding factor A